MMFHRFWGRVKEKQQQQQLKQVYLVSVDVVGELLEIVGEGPAVGDQQRHNRTPRVVQRLIPDGGSET